MTEKKSTTSSMDVFDVTFIVFFINKLAGVAPMAEWSWWLVFSPLLGQFIFILPLLHGLGQAQKRWITTNWQPS